jgi:hypothetical protein
MNKNIEKSLIKEGLKILYLNVKDLDFGVITTNSKKLGLLRDSGAIDGDLIKASIIHNYISTG